MKRCLTWRSKKRFAVAFCKAVPQISCALAFCFFSAFGRCADEPTSLPERVLHFPKDYSAGDLDIEGVQWHFFTEARGDVTIPAGKRVRLHVSQESIDRNPSVLETLQPDDLYLVWFNRRHSVCDQLFSRLKRLTGLHGITFVGCTGYQDEAFEHLKDLPSLRSLSIYGAKGLQPEVTDDAVPYLIQLKSLRYLNLKGTNISLKGYQKLRQSRPDIREITPPNNYDKLDFSVTLRATDAGGTPIAEANVTATYFWLFQVSIGSKVKNLDSPLRQGRTNSRGETAIYFHDYDAEGRRPRAWEAAFLVEAAGYQPTAFSCDTHSAPPALTVCRLRREGCPVEGRVENIPTSWTQPLVVIAAPSLPVRESWRGPSKPYEWAIAKADVGRDGQFEFAILPPGDYQLNILAAATAQWPWGEDDTQLHLLRNEIDREKVAHQEKPRYFGNLGEAKLTLPLEGPYPGPVTLKIKENVAAIYVKDEEDRPVVDARLEIVRGQLSQSFYSGSDGSIYYPQGGPKADKPSMPRSVTLYYDKVGDEYTRQTMLFASWWSAGEDHPSFLPDPDKHHFNFLEKNRKEPIRVKRR